MQNPALERLRAHNAKIAIVLGSGLSSVVGEPASDQLIDYSKFPEIPQPSVPGHAGRFILDQIGDERVIFAQGRVHLYEGLSARDVTAGIRILADAGIDKIILTNAAGATNPKFKPEDWMMITDQINLTGTTPLLGTTELVDLTAVFSPRWLESFRKAARKIDMVLREGVYAGVLGPQYETPAEVRMLRKLGADAIGMSTVLETIQACAIGIEVAGFSCLTNLAAGFSGTALSHEEVLETAEKAAGTFRRLLEAALPLL